MEAPNEEWSERLPRSLTTPWMAAEMLLLYISDAWLTEDACSRASEEEPDEEADEAQSDFAKAYVSIFERTQEKLTAAEPALRLVGDEFAAVADGVVEWLSIRAKSYETPVVANSTHELVFTLARNWIGGILDMVVYQKYGLWGLDKFAASIEIIVTMSDLETHWESLRHYFLDSPPPLGDEIDRIIVQLEQEVCRAADRRLVTKCSYPGDKEPHDESEGDSLSPRRRAKEVFVLTPLQKSILIALDGCKLKKDPLAAKCKVDPRRLYKPGGIKELRSLGKVELKNGVGYYRPDAPPPDSIDR